MTRPLFEIAREIRADWAKVNFGAAPYLQAMENIDSFDAPWGVHDDATWCVLRFLANAQTWRGEVARRVKKELKALV